MRLSQQKKRPYIKELNIAAMIDVILLLLIFFMCTRTFNTPENNLNSQSVSPGKSSQAQPSDFEPVQIVLKSNETSVNIFCDGAICTNFKDLYEQLLQRRQIADMQVIIRGSNKVPFNYLVDALDQCKKAGFTNAGFSTQEENL